MWKNLKKKFESVAGALNGTADRQQEPASTAAPSPTGSEGQQAPKPSSTGNAIDRRDKAVKLIVNSMAGATGTSAKMLADLTVWVAVPSKDFDPLDYAWADERLISDLRLALDNAMREAVGSRSIVTRFDTVDHIPENARTLVEDQLYVTWRSEAPRPKESAPVKARISAVEPMGTLRQSEYLIDSAIKPVWHIGRGAVSPAAGSYRRNDIMIHDADPSAEMQKINNHVSSNHADIVARSGRFYLKACAGGCRSLGGSPTKLVHNDKPIEITDTATLHPLADGDLIELGKSVLLQFNYV